MALARTAKVLWGAVQLSKSALPSSTTILSGSKYNRLNKLQTRNASSSWEYLKIRMDDKSGIDILELYQPKDGRLEQFWRSLQDTWMKLYCSPLATVAAITGHSPAGGCLLAMSCDHRIMAQGKYGIGLNETLLGIVAPFWFQDTLVNTVGHREAERALQLGLMYSGEQALQVGLVDELVPGDQVQDAAQRQMEIWLKIPDVARQLTKEQLRRPTVQRLANRQDDDVTNFVKFIKRDSSQRALGKYLEALKVKQNSPKQ